MEERKFCNDQKAFVYGLRNIHVERYFSNNKDALAYGQDLFRRKLVSNVLKHDNTFIAHVGDPNDVRKTNTVITQFICNPIDSERDINPTRTECNCSTFTDSKNNNPSPFEPPMCGDIAALLLSLRDTASTTSKFETAATIFKIIEGNNKSGKLYIIDDLTFAGNQLHCCFPDHPSEVFDDMCIASKLLADKYTCTFILAYSGAINTKAPHCKTCGGKATSNLKLFVWSHKCKICNESNMNNYHHRKISLFALSVLFKDMMVTKFGRIFSAIFTSKHSTFSEIGPNANIASKTFHRMAAICEIVMDNTPQFGGIKHPYIETDATKLGTQ